MSSNGDPFHSSKYNVRYGKQVAGEFKRQVVAFGDPSPYAPIGYRNSDTGEIVWKLKLVNPMPEDLSGLAHAAVNCFRSALDQAIFAIMRKKNAFFPIGPNETDFGNALNGRLATKGCPQEIVDLMRRCQPYKGGNNLLWALNEVSNAGKHAIICPMGLVAGGMSIKEMQVNNVGACFHWPLVWDRTENEMIVCHTYDPNFKMDLQFVYCIAMCNIEFVDGQPAVDVLNEFGNMVEGIVLTLEAQARRLGIV